MILHVVHYLRKDVIKVAVPILVAKTLTYPERVFEHNHKKLQQCVINGPDVHPGANFATHRNGFKRSITNVGIVAAGKR